MKVRELIEQLLKNDMDDDVYVRIDECESPEYINGAHRFMAVDGIAKAQFSKLPYDEKPLYDKHNRFISIHRPTLLLTDH